MVEKLLLVVIALQVVFWIGTHLREHRFRRNMARSMDRFAEAVSATTEKYAADLARRLSYIETQLEWLADSVSELRLEQLDQQVDQAREDPSVDFLEDYTIEPDER